MQPTKKVGDAPGNNYEQPGKWDVSVPVSQGLISNLHEANNGDKSAKVPKPANGEIWAPVHLPYHRCGYTYQQQDGACELPSEQPITEMGIKNCEVSGPKHFSNI